MTTRACTQATRAEPHDLARTIGSMSKPGNGKDVKRRSDAVHRNRCQVALSNRRVGNSQTRGINRIKDSNDRRICAVEYGVETLSFNSAGGGGSACSIAVRTCTTRRGRLGMRDAS